MNPKKHRYVPVGVQPHHAAPKALVHTPMVTPPITHPAPVAAPVVKDRDATKEKADA